MRAQGRDEYDGVAPAAEIKRQRFPQIAGCLDSKDDILRVAVGSDLCHITPERLAVAGGTDGKGKRRAALIAVCIHDGRLVFILGRIDADDDFACECFSLRLSACGGLMVHGEPPWDDD